MMQNKIYKIVSMADIHFGCAESPEYMYNQLKEQFINRIAYIDFDIVAICGDLFDSKFMATNPAITYALQFIDDLANLCRNKNACLILLAGTLSHDSNQLSLFYHYLYKRVCDFRIVEKMQFEQVGELKILCIPEMYGIEKQEYENYLYRSGYYDICLLHGTYKNSFKGSEIATLNSNHAPIFCINNFINCTGVILMGHYHIPSVYDGYAYYNGSAFRYKFGEEEEKGFLVTLYNKNTRQHYTELVPIKSHIYSTINISDLINDDPKKIIDWIKNEKETKGIDFIRVQFNNATENITIVRNYFRTNAYVKFQELDRKDKQLQQIDQKVLEQNKKYGYILDNSINDYDKFCMYINQNEGYEYITSNELIELLEGIV